MESKVAEAQVGVNLEIPITGEFFEGVISDERDCFKVLCRVLRQLARYIDRVHHSETADAAVIQRASCQLLNLACLMAQFSGLHLPTVYGQRLARIEEANGANYRSLKPSVVRPTGADIVLRASNLREMQEGQSLHDEQFHGPVIYNPEIWKLGHYVNHLTKLPALLLGDLDDEVSEECVADSLADLTAFSIKLSTEFGGYLLPEVPVQR